MARVTEISQALLANCSLWADEDEDDIGSKESDLKIKACRGKAHW